MKKIFTILTGSLIALLLSISVLMYAQEYVTYKLKTPDGAHEIQWYADTTGSGEMNPMPGEFGDNYETETPGIYFATFKKGKCASATDYFILTREESMYEYPIELITKPGKDKYVWYDANDELANESNNGEKNNTLMVKDDGEYWASITTGYCITKTPRFFTREQQVQDILESVRPVAVDDEYFCQKNTTIRFNVVTDNNTVGGVRNDWDPQNKNLFVEKVILNVKYGKLDKIGTGGAFSYMPNENFVDIDSFIYELCNEDDLCDTATVYFKDCEESINVPQLITPNGDNKNDTWKIESLANGCYENNEVYIFNRWEEIVFHTRDYGISESSWWDGYSTNNLNFRGNRRVPSGTYYYIIILDGDKKKSRTGFIHIQW